MNPWRAAASASVLALFGIGALYSRGWPFAMALPLAAWLLWRDEPSVASPGKGDIPALAATRSLSATFPAEGAPVEVAVRIENRGPRLDSVLVMDEAPKGTRILSGSAAWRGSIPAGSFAELRYAASFSRGAYDYASVTIRVEDAFTSRSASFSLSCPGSIVVPPRPMRAPPLKAGPGAVRPYSGASGARRPGEGAEFHGTRDYSPGDRLRDLNWRAGALWGESIVNVFEGDRAIDAGIILDCRAEAYGSTAAFEAAVAGSLALAESFLDGANRVAFMLYGSALLWIPPGSGSAHRYRIRMAAASAELGDHAVFERFDHLPTNVFPPRSLIALVSPLLRDDLSKLRGLIAQGYSVAVLRPDPAGGPESPPRDRAMRIAERILRLEKNLLAARLAKAGIDVMDWDPAKPLSAVGSRMGRRA